MLPILILGLPGAGKTDLAIALRDRIGGVHWNADAVRAHVRSDLGFTNEDRIEQARTMGWLAKTVTSSKIPCIADFICPLPECREAFGQAFIVYVNRISSGRFDDTNRLFIPPATFDVMVPAGMSIEQECELILSHPNFPQK